MQEDQKKPYQSAGSAAKPEDLASLWAAPSTPAKPQAEKPKIPQPEVTEAEFKPVQEKMQEKPKKEMSQKPIEAEVVSEEIASEILQEEESFVDKMDELFTELNISRKHVVGGCACIIVIAVLIYAGIWLFSGGLSNIKSKAPKEEQKEAVMYDSKKTGIYDSILFGKPYLIPLAFYTDEDLDVSFLLGDKKGAKSQFANYVLQLKQTQNAYSTDVNAMLNVASDRNAVLENHIARLKKLDEKGLEFLQKIQDEISRYNEFLTTEGARQTELEKGFFDQVKVFNPQAEDFLNDFISKAQDVVEAKARMRSLDQLQKYYTQALPRLEARIRDLELNKEALVAGIKVYDVKGSDLNLIMTESGAGQAETKGSAFPLLSPVPTNATGQDFVTKPTVGQKASTKK